MYTPTNKMLEFFLTLGIKKKKRILLEGWGSPLRKLLGIGMKDRRKVIGNLRNGPGDPPRSQQGLWGGRRQKSDHYHKGN